MSSRVQKCVDARAFRDNARDSPFLQSRNPTMRLLLESAARAAASDGTILLVGESGSGKGWLARHIHLWSARSRRPFSTIDCSRFAPSVESRFHSDAQRSREAYISERLVSADRGTLFLANVEELPAELQLECARFVRERTVPTLSGEKAVDVRIIAACNRDLMPEVNNHRFRADLYYGLNVISLRIPALRERLDDLVSLAEGMLSSAAICNRRRAPHLSRQAADIMSAYSWPGNLRELRNAMEASAILCEGDTVGAANLPIAVRNNFAQLPTVISPNRNLQEIEREHISRVLAESPTLAEAAAKLGINVTTLWRKRRRYNLDSNMGQRFRRTFA